MTKNVPESDDSSSSSSLQQPSAVFIITGFGAFNGVSENPTSAIMACVNDHPRSDVLHAHVFETSANCVQRDMSKWFQNKFYFEQPHRLVETQPIHIILLLLGVDSGSSCFSMETCCYNDASFRVPDEQGFQPWRLPIDSSLPLGTCKETPLNVSNLVDKYSLEYPDSRYHKIRISNDPGRFVCNYTYFYALNKAQEWNDTVRGDSDPKVHALFIHVPPFDVIPQSEQLDFLYQMMNLVQRQMVGGLT